MKKFKSWDDVPVGTKFKVIENAGGHNYPMNAVLTTARSLKLIRLSKQSIV